MLNLVEPTDHPEQPKRGSSVGSFLVSIAFHGLLAIVLWCVVYEVVQRRRSISLTGSADSVSQAIDQATLELAAQEEPVVPAVIDHSADTASAAVEVRSLISKSVDQETIAQSNASALEPPSAEFFGTRAFGNRFVFVLDISYSMKARNGERFRRASNELIRSVSALRNGQRYFVFLFCWSTEQLLYDYSHQYVDVTDGHEDRLRGWLDNIRLGPGTDPRRALSYAHRMDPDAVFLLSDGHFNRPHLPKRESGWIDANGDSLEADVQQGVELLFKSIPVHTIAFENPFTAAAMQQIATTTGGYSRYVKTQSLEPVDEARFETALRKIESTIRSDGQRQSEFQMRLAYARELMSEGELAYAEFLIRPLRDANESEITNPLLLSQVLSILETELGETRLEDFGVVP